MPNLTPAQLAEGARLLAAMRNRPDSRASYLDDELWDFFYWVQQNIDALLSAAQRIAEVEGCVREAIAKLQWCAQLNADGLERNPGTPYYDMRKDAFDDAIEYVREIAEEHNIDLSEPGTEPPKGQPEGGDV